MKPIILQIIIALWFGVFSKACALSLLSPPDRTFVETALVTLVVGLDGKNVNDVKVAMNGKDLDRALKPTGDFHVAFAGVRLTPGKNYLKITGYRDGKLIAELDCLLFFKNDLDPVAATPPSGFSRYYFHTQDREKVCAPCHRLDFSKIPGNPSEPGKSPCRDCHGKLLDNYRFVHGPAAVWSCTECHETRGSGRKLAVPKPSGKVCSPCHENDWSRKKYPHGPTAAGNCTACHDPHASNENYFLRISTSDLCVACHPEIASKPHVISGFSGAKGHPVRLSHDPLNPGRDFTCASCHNPHATDFPLMLSEDHTSMFQFCQTCHRM